MEVFQIFVHCANHYFSQAFSKSFLGLTTIQQVAFKKQTIFFIVPIYKKGNPTNKVKNPPRSPILDFSIVKECFPLRYDKLSLSKCAQDIKQLVSQGHIHSEYSMYMEKPFPKNCLTEIKYEHGKRKDPMLIFMYLFTL